MALEYRTNVANDNTHYVIWNKPDSEGYVSYLKLADGSIHRDKLENIKVATKEMDEFEIIALELDVEETKIFLISKLKNVNE